MKAFLKKEWMESVRTGRLLILTIIFVLLGIMNPAIAKLTPWLMDMMKESIADSGLAVGEVTVNAMTSWTQYYKNASIVLIVMVLLSSTTFTNEYQKGTLIQVVTKGLSRRKIFFSKLLTGYVTWTVLFLLYTGVTFAYTMYFWGEDEVPNLIYGIVFFWFLGMMIMSLLAMFGTLSSNSGQVLLGTGGFLFITILLGYVPSISKVMPLKLLDGLQLCNEKALVSDFTGALIFSSVTIVICVIIGMLAFDKKKL